MQQNCETILEELETLEGYVELGGTLPYGPFYLFKKLANRYPSHFIQFMKKHRGEASGEEPHSVCKHLPIALAAVKELSLIMEQHLTNEPVTDEEKRQFQYAVERLENLLWLKNFKVPHFTHFLDIAYNSGNAEGRDKISLFYQINGSTLNIQVTDQEGKKLEGHSFPIKPELGNVKHILSAVLVSYFSLQGSQGDDGLYLWSNLFSRQQYEQLRHKGRGGSSPFSA